MFVPAQRKEKPNDFVHGSKTMKPSSERLSEHITLSSTGSP